MQSTEQTKGNSQPILADYLNQLKLELDEFMNSNSRLVNSISMARGSSDVSNINDDRIEKYDPPSTLFDSLHDVIKSVKRENVKLKGIATQIEELFGKS